MRTLRLAALGLIGLGMLAAVPAVLAETKPANTPTQREEKPRTRGQEPLGQFTSILQQLNLTDDQKTQIKPILEDLKAKVRTAMESQDREAVRAAMMDARKQVGEVLTDTQKAKFRELLAQNVGGPGGAQGQTDNIVERLRTSLEDLNLTDDQKAQIKEIFQSYRPKIEEIRKNSGDNPQAAREQIRPLIQEMREKIKAILTPEQAEKFQQKMGAARERAGQPATRPRDGNRPNQRPLPRKPAQP